MSHGFFITIAKASRRNSTPATYWRTNLADEIKNWPSSTGQSLIEVIDLQKQQFLARQLDKKEIPFLVTSAQGPMASGKITRFVQIS